MCDELGITEDIKTLVRDVLSKNDFGSSATIKYFPGSEVGDGYGSKTIGVEITEGTKSLHLFLKCALTIARHESFDRIYAVEIQLYKTIYPTYQNFLRDKGIEDGFRNVPKCYGILEKPGSEIIALENLRKKNFTLFDRTKCMNDEHLQLILKAFAKFHAISFALKDQQREVHDKFTEGVPNIFICLQFLGFDKVIANIVDEFISKLDPVEDKDILDRSNGLSSKVREQFLDMDDHLTEYSILTKGDCWVNNLMVSYQNGDTDHPLDVMLVDWQGVTRASPVHDIGPLFLQVSTEETLDNLKYYLRVYHEELSRRIKELGSDPEKMYPYEAFEREWIKYGLYSFGLALLSVKMMLCKKENAPVLEKMDVSKMSSAAEQLFGNIRDNDEQVLIRWKYIARHLIQIGTF